MYNIDEQQRMNEEGQHFVFLISTRPNMYEYIVAYYSSMLNLYFVPIDFSIYLLHVSKSNNSSNPDMRNAIFDLTLI